MRPLLKIFLTFFPKTVYESPTTLEIFKKPVVKIFYVLGCQKNLFPRPFTVTVTFTKKKLEGEARAAAKNPKLGLHPMIQRRSVVKLCNIDDERRAQVTWSKQQLS